MSNILQAKLTEIDQDIAALQELRSVIVRQIGGSAVAAHYAPAKEQSTVKRRATRRRFKAALEAAPAPVVTHVTPAPVEVPTTSDAPAILTPEQQAALAALSSPEPHKVKKVKP